MQGVARGPGRPRLAYAAGWLLPAGAFCHRIGPQRCASNREMTRCNVVGKQSRIPLMSKPEDAPHRRTRMTDEKQALAGRSNKLLDALRHLKETEEQKRQVPISTPTFHELANDVNATSREIFRIARDQDHLGDSIPTGSETIEDVDRRSESG